MHNRKEKVFSLGYVHSAQIQGESCIKPCSNENDIYWMIQIHLTKSFDSPNYRPGTSNPK